LPASPIRPEEILMPLRHFQPTTLHAPPNYSHAVLASGGPLLVVSGQVALDADGQLVGRGDFEAQAVQVMRNLETALEAGGCGFQDVVRFGVLITDRANIPTWRAVRTRFVKEPFPASTLMVCGLVHEDWLIEVEAMALVPGG
jgi:enamine deaminase RidA (YjgF/YER057c/UK114 family)